MKFTAINVENGSVVEGCGVCAASNENVDDWTIYNDNATKLAETYGKDVSYLFTDKMDWVDGSEFNVSDFYLVYTNSIKMNI